MTDQAEDQSLAKEPVEPRTARDLLVERGYGTLFWGKTGSTIATWAFTVVILTAAYELTESPTWVGVIGAAQMAPQLLFSTITGRFADLHGERLLIILGTLLQGVAYFGLGGWWWAAGQDSPVLVWALLVCTLVNGCGLAMMTSPTHSIVRRMVPPEDLSTAVALNTLQTAMSRTIGPAFGAVLLALAGTNGSLLIIGAASLAATVAFLWLPRLPRRTQSDGADNSILGSVRYVVADRILLIYLAGVAMMCTAAEPLLTLSPNLAAELGNPDLAGWVMACFGVGGIFGFAAHRLLQRRVPPGIEGFVATVVLAATLVPAALTASLPVLFGAVGVAGCSLVVATTGFSVAVQHRADPAFNGRVMALWVIAFAGLRPLAAVLVGSAADLWSLDVAFYMTAAVVTLVVVGLFAVARRTKRNHEAPRH